ncbi:MAG TPA: nucleotidyltransferase domain-containing protein [Terracidiphilus sp.]|nr:nucleotidyltransferase domain-containing protein [Terracidiphilus sp.]
MFSLRSQLRRDLLTHFHLNRSARPYVRQLAASIHADPTNVSRELARLERDGLLRAEVEGRQLYYCLNRQSPILKPLFALLRGSIGIEPTLRTMVAAVPGIKSAWLYGSFAKGEADAASDIDLLVVGSPDQAKLASEARKAEKILRREINYTVFTAPELEQRLAARDAFLLDIWNGRRIRIAGNEDPDGHETAAGPTRADSPVPARRSKKGRRGPQNPRSR